MKPTFEQRLWRRVKVGNPDDCWEWQGKLCKNGYAKLSREGGRNAKEIYSHRAVYELTKGPIPPGYDVCHKCDNRCCCNPFHLFIGTSADNLHDMINKGRADHTKNRKAQDHGMAKLTNEQVIEIRNSYTGKRGEQARLAGIYGVTKYAIYRIVHRLNWHSI